MNGWHAMGYWVWGLGAVLLGVMFAWAYAVYRSRGALRDPAERERMARQNAAARAEKRPGDPAPALPKDALPLAIMICAAIAAAVIVLGITWMNRSPTFAGDRAPIAQSR